jgi:hypothetical protein
MDKFPSFMTYHRIQNETNHGSVAFLSAATLYHGNHGSVASLSAATLYPVFSCFVVAQIVVFFVVLCQPLFNF